jgi:hypothetical protein
MKVGREMTDDEMTNHKFCRWHDEMDEARVTLRAGTFG